MLATTKILFLLYYSFIYISFYQSFYLYFFLLIYLSIFQKSYIYISIFYNYQSDWSNWKGPPIGNIPWNQTPSSFIPPPHKKMRVIRLRSGPAISALSCRWGGGGSDMLMPPAFTAPFYYISLKNIKGGGYYAARGLVSRDIAATSF